MVKRPGSREEAAPHPDPLWVHVGRRLQLRRTQLGIKAYAAEDGETVAMAQFESREALLQWRDHPEHLEAQRAGRERFYASYDVRICSIERAYDFSIYQGNALV